MDEILVNDLKKVLKERQGFPYVYDWYDEPGTEYPAHSHKGQVMIYIVQGSVEFEFAEGKVPLYVGACFDVPVGMEHTAKVGPEGCTFVAGEMIEGDS